MVITAFTDASFNPNTHDAGWACWIVYGQGYRICKSFAIKNKIDSAQEAEMMAIINTIFVIRKEIRLSKTDIILIQTDCLNAIGLFQGRVTKNSRIKYGYLIEAFNTLVSDLDCKIKFKHIKSHRKIDSARSYVNSWCDVQAKKEMYKKVTIESFEQRS